MRQVFSRTPRPGQNLRPRLTDILRSSRWCIKRSVVRVTPNRTLQPTPGWDRARLNSTFGERGTLRGLRLELATTRAGLDWSVGLSVQRYAPGPRPSVGLQASVLVPLGAAGALLD